MSQMKRILQCQMATLVSRITLNKVLLFTNYFFLPLFSSLLPPISLVTPFHFKTIFLIFLPVFISFLGKSKKICPSLLSCVYPRVSLHFFFFVFCPRARFSFPQFSATYRVFHTTRHLSFSLERFN
uniref:Uncharacterized protein n=1 Tax=Cacopsylla melanoneura TaxID=428564 RepID=A0A8D9FA86_9HEMI